MRRFGYDFEAKIIELEEKLKNVSQLASQNPSFEGEVKELERKIEELKKKVYGRLTPWQRVLFSRHPERPKVSDFISALLDRFVPVQGDRLFAADSAIVAGIGFLDGKEVAVCGTDKGKTTRENLTKNFGMAQPEGYRKCLLTMELAERFNIPLLTFIDTPGAYPGIGAEERGQAWAIARCIEKMLWLQVPTLAIFTGEGGSGGAIAIACADRILMLENAYYSVISPEGCASILWHDEKRAEEAADVLKFTANDLYSFGLVHEVIREPPGGSHRDPVKVYGRVRESIKKHLNELTMKETGTIIEERHNFYRQIGNIFK